MALRRLKNLSDNPGTAILQALDDLRAVERMKARYVVSMGTWHEPQADGRCAVCLAGAVMARRDAVTPLDEVSTSHFVEADARKLDALDAFRSSWWSGCSYWTKGFSDGWPYEVAADFFDALPYVPPYDFDPRGFKAALRRGAKALEKEWPRLRRRLRKVAA